MRSNTMCLMQTLLCFSAIGCGDPVRTTLQAVRLQVKDSISGQPLVGVKLFLKSDFDKRYPFSETELTKKDWDHRKNFWEQQSWFESITDKHGIASITVTHTQIDRTWGSKPPPSRDQVTNQPYIVKVQLTSDKIANPVEIVLADDKTGNGSRLTVTVLEVGKPQYIEEK